MATKEQLLGKKQTKSVVSLTPPLTTAERDAQRKLAADTRSERRRRRAEAQRKRRAKQQGTPEHREKLHKRNENYASQRDTLNAARRDHYATQPEAEREAANAARRDHYATQPEAERDTANAERREKYDESRMQQLERRRAKRALSVSAPVDTCTRNVRHTMDVIEEPTTAPAAPSGVPAALPEAHKQHLQNQVKENKKQEARLNDEQRRWLNNEIPGPLHEQPFAKAKVKKWQYDQATKQSVVCCHCNERHIVSGKQVKQDWKCGVCMKNPKLFSKENNMDPGEIPAELAALLHGSSPVCECARHHLLII